MNPRAWLIGLLLTSPAWSQEVAPGSFDLKSDAVRSIVRATAVTEYALTQPIEEGKKQAGLPGVITLDEVPVRPQAPEENSAAPRKAVIKPNGLFAAVVDILVDTAVHSLLGIDQSQDIPVSCAAPDDKATPLQFEKHPTCWESASALLGLGN